MTRFHNRTRRSASIPGRLVREGRWYLLPVYAIGRTSSLAREAIEHSGSAEFADHIYRGRASGSFVIGWLLDALFLRLPSARSFRTRYVYARDEILALLAERARSGRPAHILSVPCGLARELFDAAEWLAGRTGAMPQDARLRGIDLDEALVRSLNARADPYGGLLRFEQGDALSTDAYTDAPYDLVVSLGFTEFLDDEATVRFYRLVRASLARDGRFVTSGNARHRLSDYLLRNLAELEAHYRSPDDLRRLAREAGFTAITTHQDRRRLQTMLVAGADDTVHTIPGG